MSASNQRLKVQVHLPVFLDDLLNHPPRLLILLERALDEDVPQIRVRYLFLRDLNPRPALQLQGPYGVPALPDNQTHTLVRDRDDIGVGARRPVRGQ